MYKPYSQRETQMLKLEKQVHFISYFILFYSNIGNWIAC